jgi:hypothetical protein
MFCLIHRLWTTGDDGCVGSSISHHVFAWQVQVASPLLASPAAFSTSRKCSMAKSKLKRWTHTTTGAYSSACPEAPSTPRTSLFPPHVTYHKRRGAREMMRPRWQATATRSPADPSLVLLHFVGWDESRDEVSRAVFSPPSSSLSSSSSSSLQLPGCHCR